MHLFFKKQFNNLVLFFIYTIGLNAWAVEIPKQFYSNSAIEVLGLQSSSDLTRDIVRKAAKKLSQKYHPDKIKSSGIKYTKSQLEFVLTKINTGRDKLLKAIKANGGSIKNDFTANEFEETIVAKATKAATAPESKNSEPNFTDPHSYYRYRSESEKDRAFSDFVKQSANYEPFNSYNSENSVSPTGISTFVKRYGSQFNFHSDEPYCSNCSTDQKFLFGYLPKDLEHLYMDFASVAIEGNYEYSMTLVFHKATFPIMEARFYKRGQAPMHSLPSTVKIIKAEFKPRHHRGGSGRYFDAIVFDNNAYIMPFASSTLKVQQMPNMPRGNYALDSSSPTHFMGFGKIDGILFAPEQDYGNTFKKLTGKGDTESTQEKSAKKEIPDPKRQNLIADLQMKSESQVILLGHQQSEAEDKAAIPNKPENKPANQTEPSTKTSGVQTPKVEVTTKQVVPQPNISKKTNVPSIEVLDPYDALYLEIENLQKQEHLSESGQEKRIASSEILAPIAEKILALIPATEDKSTDRQIKMSDLLESWFSLKNSENFPEIIDNIINYKMEFGYYAIGRISANGNISNLNFKAKVTSALLKLADQQMTQYLFEFLKFMEINSVQWQDEVSIFKQIFAHQKSHPD